MERHFHLSIVTFILIALFISVGCVTKETPTLENVDGQFSSESGATQAPEAELRDNAQRSPEAELKDNPRRSPEAERKDRPRSPEAELKDSPRRSPEAELRDKSISPESEKSERLDPSPEADFKRVAEVSEEKIEIEDKSEVNIAEDAVLHLIPNATIGVIYCPSLLELNDRINNVATELVPQVGQSPELLAQLLADAFDAGFESLEELEDIGLDLNKDFAVFLTGIEPPSVAAIVHLTDPETIKTVIESEADDSAPIEYNGVTYWNSDEGSYVILDNILVYAQYPETCENVIDIKNKKSMSIVQNTNYTPFISTIAQDTEQIAAFFNLQSVVEPFIGEIREEIQSTIDSLQSDPDAMPIVPLIENTSEQILVFLEELNLVSISLQIEETDVLLSQNLHFKKDGKIEQALSDLEPDELALINDLPNDAFVCGGVKANFEIFFDLTRRFLEGFSISDLPETLDNIPDIIAQIESMVQDIADLNDTFSNELCFSVNYNENLIPDYLYIINLKNEQKLKTYMNESFLIQIEKLIRLIQENIEDVPQLGMFDGVHYGNSIMHNEAEIKSIVFPNFGDAFIDVEPEVVMMLPQEWQWSYTFSDGRFYFCLGGPQQIQAALDSKAKIGESLAENISFQEIIEKLGADNNILYSFSPITMVRGIVSRISDANPNMGAEMQVLSGVFDGIDENHSIGFSAKVQDKGISTKFIITLGDFKQLINTIMMLSGMGMLIG